MTVADGSTLNFDTANGGQVVIRLLNDSGLTVNNGYSFTIATAGANSAFTISGDPNTACVLNTHYILTSANFTFEDVSLARSNGALVLTFTPVPEPATVLGIAAVALGAGGYVRRRLRGTAADSAAVA